MEGGDGGVQPRSHRSPSTRIKRKKSPIKNRSAHSIKRQKIVFNKEIVTQEFDSAQNRPSSSTSIPDSCSTRKHKGRKIKRSRFRDNSRQWVWCSRDFSSYKDKVIVLSYNILGVENASNHQDLYFNVSPKLLKWKWRKKLITEEISHYNPEILCFQEVDRFDDLEHLLNRDGLRGVYKARTGEAKDGCAMFWKDDKST